jgi:hypothetical protein
MRKRKQEQLIQAAGHAHLAWKALGDILVAAGVIDPNAGEFTGPELLNAADAYLDYLSKRV